MKTNGSHDFHNDDADDPVWRLVDRGTRTQPTSHFVNDVIRTARLTSVEKVSWWSRFRLPIGFGSMATAGTVAVMAVCAWFALKPAEVAAPDQAAVPAAHAELASLDEVAQTELLVDASENPADFSDSELLAIMGL